MDDRHVNTRQTGGSNRRFLHLTYLFDYVVVVCLVAVDLRFVISILNWTQHDLLTGDKKRF